MTDYSKRMLSWFAIICVCTGGVLAFQFFAGQQIKWLPTQEKTQ
jgi:hypothetical protein